MENNQVKFTQEFFIMSLSERVTQANAKMLFDSALTASGVGPSVEFKKEDAQTICMALIKKGGPAFQVGAKIYKQYLQ